MGRNESRLHDSLSIATSVYMGCWKDLRSLTVCKHQAQTPVHDASCDALAHSSPITRQYGSGTVQLGHSPAQTAFLDRARWPAFEGIPWSVVHVSLSEI